MLSMMNNDSELDRRSDTIEENEVNLRVSDDVGVSSTGEGSVNMGASDEGRVSLMELDSVAEESGGCGDGARVSENERPEEVGARACKWSEDDEIKEMVSRVSEIKTEGEIDVYENPQNRSPEIKNEGFDDQNQVNIQYDEFGAEVERKVQTGLKVDRRAESEKYTVPDYKSLLSEFDDYVASEKIGTGISRALSYGFEVGDMIWGKVKSHPWWPGHIFNEALASSSVRWTRRPGYVLVAFFGDSSYGWFDPAEIIPFEPNYADKSQQIVSRYFLRAVEEAVDEASRRSALGLACKCRNPSNFRPTGIEGYFAVDVPDYEPQAVYSADQIKKARESFGPSETLSFVKQLALAPQEGDSETIEFLKNKATVFSFRKAVFEEFDETYAQAFGVQSSRPSTKTHDQPVKEPPRAPLSGPLVIAEALGDGKSSKKSMKVKDNSKQDRYLFKRRDEAGGDSRTVQVLQVPASSSASPLGCTDGSLADDYVLHRRTPTLQTPMKDEQTVFICKDFTNSSGDFSGKESLDARLPLDKGKGFVKVSKERVGQNADICQRHGEALLILKHDEYGNSFRSNEGFQQSGHLSSLGSGQYFTPIEAKKTSGGVIKKVKVPKRPSGDMTSENSASELKKKKKKKKDPGSELSSDHPQKKTGWTSEKRGLEVGSSLKNSAQLNLQKKDVGSPTMNIRNIELEVQQLLSDLQALALDPFYGAEKSAPGIVRQFFLRFRSLVYQKSLVLSPPSDTEPVEGRSIRPPTSENAKDIKPSKPVKGLNRTIDPTKSGRKRLPSDRQEEIAAKKLKKMNQMKSVSAEKKAGQRTSEATKTEGKEQTGLGPTPTKPGKEQSGLGLTPVKPVKAHSIKKTELTPSKIVEPTMLVMKFPPGTSLPSAAQLKARFGRFGLLDQSAIRVFWKSSTCRVVFLYKADAQTAYRYATGNNSLFGNVNVRYFLRDVEAPAGEGQESLKGKGDDVTSDSLRFKEPGNEWPGQAGPIHQPILQPLPVGLKSCLKKPTSDDIGNGNRRVKFMLGGEETPPRATEQLAVSSSRNTSFNNNNNFGSFGDAGGPSSSSSSSVAMEFNSKNISNVVRLPPQYVKPQLINNMDHVEAPQPRNFHNMNSQSAAPSSGDISQQMLCLLTRCNDVVTNVTGLLGYVPYHPL